MEHILEFLRAVDEKLVPFAKMNRRLPFWLIGRVALIMRLGKPMATRDVDCLQIPPGSDGHELHKRALALFGKGTDEANKWGLFLEEVPPALPPIPAGFQQNSQEIPGDWRILLPRLPRPDDLAVTKLRRFHAKDREDIRIMCDEEWLHSNELRQAFDSAFGWHYKGDEHDDVLIERARANLASVLAYLEGQTRSLE